MGNRVSVIIPVYNAAPFLERAVTSAMGQRDADIEVVLVDDGSTDGSRELCDELAEADGRVRVVAQENAGPAAARNNGVSHAEGDFIFFLDADDYIPGDAVATLLEAAAGGADLVMSNFDKLVDGETVDQAVTFEPDGAPFSGARRSLDDQGNRQFVRHFLKHPSNHMISYCWARLYRRAIIEEHRLRADEGMRLFEDFIFNLEYLRRTRRAVFVNRPLYTYVMHETHISASMAIMNTVSLLHDMAIFRREAAAYLRERGVDEELALAEIGHCLVHYVIIFMIRSGRQVNRQSWDHVHDQFRQMVHAPLFRECLRHYRPARGNSRVMPVLMRRRASRMLVLYCRQRAYARYGKPGGGP